MGLGGSSIKVGRLLGVAWVARRVLMMVCRRNVGIQKIYPTRGHVLTR